MNCPICASNRTRPVECPKRLFFRCDFCGFSWADPTDLPEEETSRRRYRLHQNNEDHEGYIAFLSRIIDRALMYIGNPRNTLKVLDWGSGPNPIGVKLLKQRGFEAVPWDPLFANGDPPGKEVFDLAFCIETAEHFTHPVRDFRSFALSLKPGGWGFVHTHISPPGDEEFLQWWYIQDITHVSFYSEKSLEILGAIGSLSFMALEDENFAVFRRPLPVLVGGGINLDIEGRPHGKLIIRDSNPGRIHFSPGGCGRNIAENLSRLGLGTELVSVVGDDVFGEGLKESSKAGGIGIGGIHVSKGKVTSAYLSLLDNQGDMAAAVSGMDIFDDFTPKIAEKALEQAAASAYNRSFGADPEVPFSKLLIDGNLLPETSLFIRRRFPDLPCWFDPVSVTKIRRIAAYQQGIVLNGLEGIKCNILEAQALIGDVGLDLETPDYIERLLQSITVCLKEISIVYITLGSDGALRLDASGAVLFKGLSQEPVSATGAGDAFLAASLRQRIIGNKNTLNTAADLIAGTVAAYLTLKSPQAVSPDMNPEALESLILEWNHESQGTQVGNAPHAPLTTYRFY